MQMLVDPLLEASQARRSLKHERWTALEKFKIHCRREMHMIPPAEGKEGSKTSSSLESAPGLRGLLRRGLQTSVLEVGGLVKPALWGGQP